MQSFFPASGRQRYFVVYVPNVADSRADARAHKEEDEPKLQKAARAVEQLVEQSVQGLSSLPRETRQWVKSAQANEIHQQPIAQLQNPESQARYTRYIVIFVCYVLRIVTAKEADKESKDTESSEGSSTNNSSNGDSSSSSDYSDESPPKAHTGRQVKVDPIKDAREMFP
ncbi:hypothetical protein PMIN07_012583 [Paraphaeosphaeria minitans]